MHIRYKYFKGAWHSGRAKIGWKDLNPTTLNLSYLDELSDKENLNEGEAQKFKMKITHLK